MTANLWLSLLHDHKLYSKIIYQGQELYKIATTKCPIEQIYKSLYFGDAKVWYLPDAR